MSKIYHINHHDQDYEVVISHRHNKGIRYIYRNARFEASAPMLVLDSYIIKRLKDKYIDYLLSRQSPPPITDEYVYIYGNKYPNHYPNKMAFNDGSVLTYNDTQSFYKSAKKIFLKEVENRIRYYERLMNLPMHHVIVRAMKTRFGTFSKRTNRICISLYLFHHSLEMIDSVIVHELAHHLVFNHSSAFYQIVYKYFPNYKAVHKLSLIHI